MVYSQTQILEKEVYLIEQLGRNHESMNHLKAIVFVQPTEANFTFLKKEIAEPKFKEYHLFFSNILPLDMLTRLAHLDEHEIILQVQEFFADYLPVNEDFFHLGIENSLILSSPSSRTLDSSHIFDRNVSGLLSVLLSLKRRPSQIRYQASSELARRLASDLITNIEKEDALFDFKKQEGQLVLILDRRDDPVTPLLTQWTYQAMVHELLGLNNNRVLLKGAPNIREDLEEVVLSITQDEFFRDNRYANFGDLGTSVKKLMDDYQKEAKLNDNISSIQDMQAFLERYPAFRGKSLNVSKHVALISELARLTDKCQLLDISQLEQEIACHNDHSGQKQQLIDKLRNQKVKFADKFRLLLLFLSRYESYDEIKELRTLLVNASPQHFELIDAFFEYAGDTKRAPGLFAGSTIIAQFTNTFKSNVSGVQNVYTQHQPLLQNVLNALLSGKLKDSVYPSVSSSMNASTASTNGRPSEIIIFMVGGATYEEAMKVAEFNVANPSLKVILGGSCIHNSTSFLKEIFRAFIDKSNRSLDHMWE
jgi:vacuolar protein sorting-associated protein 45